METIIESMVFILAAIILIPSLFKRVRNWKHYNKLIIIVLIIYIPIGIWWIFIKNSNSNKNVKNIQFNTDSNSTSVKFHIDTTTKTITTNSDSNTGVILKHIPKKSDRENPIQKNKEGDNNSIGRDNKGIQGKNNSNNHIVNGPNNGINGDVNIGNIPKSPDQITLKEIVDSIKNRDTDIYLKESTTNEPNRTYCKKLKALLNANGYHNVYLPSYSDVMMGICPEPGIHITRTINAFIICVSEE